MKSKSRKIMRGLTLFLVVLNVFCFLVLPKAQDIFFIFALVNLINYVFLCKLEDQYAKIEEFKKQKTKVKDLYPKD